VPSDLALHVHSFHRENTHNKRGPANLVQVLRHPTKPPAADKKSKILAGYQTAPPVHAQCLIKSRIDKKREEKQNVEK